MGSKGKGRPVYCQTRDKSGLGNERGLALVLRLEKALQFLPSRQAPGAAPLLGVLQLQTKTLLQSLATAQPAWFSWMPAPCEPARVFQHCMSTPAIASLQGRCCKSPITRGSVPSFIPLPGPSRSPLADDPFSLPKPQTKLCSPIWFGLGAGGLRARPLLEQWCRGSAPAAHAPHRALGTKLPPPTSASNCLLLWPALGTAGLSLPFGVLKAPCAAKTHPCACSKASRAQINPFQQVFPFIS